MKTGQIFKAKSKIDKDFKEFMYCGTVENNNEPYNHLIRNTANGEESFIEPAWFDNRKIILVGDKTE
jgi:hypothetical protein